MLLFVCDKDNLSRDVTLRRVRRAPGLTLEIGNEFKSAPWLVFYVGVNSSLPVVCTYHCCCTSVNTACSWTMYGIKLAKFVILVENCVTFITNLGIENSSFELLMTQRYDFKFESYAESDAFD